MLYYYASAALVLGCANDGILAGRLEACGLLTQGEIGPGSFRGFYAPNDCYQRCLAAAECEDLRRAACRTDLTLLLECDGQCALRCISDDAPYGVNELCDGAPQCTDGSDEADCPGNELLSCSDGVARWGQRCDGVFACPDGYDETSCPASVCDGTREYAAWERCNGYPFCRDGADERDCPSYVCANGERLVFRDPALVVRCDGFGQCSDRSDELGCATLQATCF